MGDYVAYGHTVHACFFFLSIEILLSSGSGLPLVIKFSDDEHLVPQIDDTFGDKYKYDSTSTGDAYHYLHTSRPTSSFSRPLYRDDYVPSTR